MALIVLISLVVGSNMCANYAMADIEGPIVTRPQVEVSENKETLKGNFEIFYMLAKYVPGDIKYIFTKFYRHISTNNEANRKFVILISNFSIRL
jgi:hypothetical protein